MNMTHELQFLASLALLSSLFVKANAYTQCANGLCVSDQPPLAVRVIPAVFFGIVGLIILLIIGTRCHQRRRRARGRQYECYVESGNANAPGFSSVPPPAYAPPALTYPADSHVAPAHHHHRQHSNDALLMEQNQIQNNLALSNQLNMQNTQLQNQQSMNAY
ncbi:hypothetical protein C8R43DRAFT_708827 [Mycena crocata]|nr:hypothetical protein C8R43DRAFT_708827 [Mycena crocata]